jgi:non-homologous end joining protein Ku
VDKKTVDLDLGVFHDTYREKMEALISSKLKGEKVLVEEKKPKKPEAKSMMEALRKTAESLKWPIVDTHFSEILDKKRDNLGS